ncbi:MAG TPA: LysE family translocator [Gaiellaceae bacterium]|nr:LysE family translocator [Gaiellaceae bacterium]
MIGFVLVSALVICTPGPDTALTIRNTPLGGRGNGLRTAQGVAVGQALWTLAASAGVAALVAASQPVFVAVRIAGAAYLVWLGVQALAAAVRGRRDERRPRGSRAGFRQGLLSNLANPKMAIFFTSLLPQFGSGFGELLGLGLLFSTMTLAWLSTYALVVARTHRLLARGRVRRVLDAVTGVALVAFGARLAAERT